MDEKQGKEICKWIVENGQKQLSKEEKELIKQAIDESQNWGEMFLTAISYMVIE